MTGIAVLMSVPILVIAVLLIKTVVHVSFVRLATLEEQQRGIEIVDRNNKTLLVVRKSDAEPIGLSSMANNFKHAVIATEDKNFYSHHGIDVLGVIRAFIANAQAGRIVEGGSTISQQLAKVNFLHRQDRSYARKIKEAAIALDLETCYPKDRILETYLNNVYFGRGAYGIERAAETYFGKPAAKLNLAESSFLAGLIQAPSTLGAKKHYSAAKRRQQVVLQAMTECGYISKAQSKAAAASKLALKSEPYSLKHPYYVSHVLSKVKATIGEDRMWQTPLRVETSIDPRAQAAAEQQLNRGLKKAPSGLNQGALVTISVKDGSVLAMVGGVGPFRSSQWNRALYPHTAGSTMKPFVYLAGLIQDQLGPDSVVNDAPFVVPNSDGSVYSPKNYDNQFKGLMTVRDALALSRNVCAVAVANFVGIEHVIETARDAGIKSKLEPYLSTALGACAVTPLELANAYATLARDGVYMEPTFVRAITTSDGKVLSRF
ncbi:MAG: transglycosylase domain-containing protein, partial [Cyanobacteria bacterium]|nr:transglycosylase domain-containing protein [Cyanobacteriota bacterium]